MYTTPDINTVRLFFLHLAFFYIYSLKKIALISDTHSFLGKDVINHLESADEIWHAGDIGNFELFEQLENISVVRGVYGNIDDHKVRSELPLDNFFRCEGVKVFMTHIGGYPGRYTKRVKVILDKHRPDLYICGHSHICKVLKDAKLNILHMNPGACGHFGTHLFRTMLLFECHNSEIKNLRLVELGRRGRSI